ncbi:UNVERIFIED_CONTAM: hypothetical protein K2H54_049954 [Gekko kuhli]
MLFLPPPPTALTSWIQISLSPYNHTNLSSSFSVESSFPGSFNIIGSVQLVTLSFFQNFHLLFCLSWILRVLPFIASDMRRLKNQTIHFAYKFCEVRVASP